MSGGTLSVFLSSPACGGGVSEADGGGSVFRGTLNHAHARNRGFKYELQNVVDPGGDVMVPYSENGESGVLDLSVSRGVPGGRVGAPMLIAVELDHKPRIKAREVNDESVDCMLPAKAQVAELSVLQANPQPSLGVWHIAPERARIRVWLSHRASLPPSGPSDHLPRKRGRKASPSNLPHKTRAIL